MAIEIHEWPLPSDALEAKSTVVELDMPRWFGAWRDASVHLLLDVLHAEYSQAPIPEVKYPLHNY